MCEMIETLWVKVISSERQCSLSLVRDPVGRGISFPSNNGRQGMNKPTEYVFTLQCVARDTDNERALAKRLDLQIRVNHYSGETLAQAKERLEDKLSELMSFDDPNPEPPSSR